MATNPPTALGNLAKIAELDLAELLTAVKNGDKGSVNTLKQNANDTMKRNFADTWRQSSIHVEFDLENERLTIMVVDSVRDHYTLKERSDGMRQFVALQAFTTCERAENPILLIDEAELHLHYDAQADLMQMFAKQPVSPKIIYTTHSAGCLPEDLGVGVHMAVRGDDEHLFSKVENKFWKSDHNGFSPMLIMMGASTLAFFPTRNALLGEGPSEMLLLPSMLREATGQDILGFQVVPILSSTSNAEIPSLSNLGKKVQYIVDGDKGGNDLIKNLSRDVSGDLIFTLTIGNNKECTLEDFISKTLLVEAVNKWLGKYHPSAKKIVSRDIKENLRMSKIENALKNQGIDKVSKVDISYEILSLIQEKPNRKLLDNNNKKHLKKIAEEILKGFAPSDTK